MRLTRFLLARRVRATAIALLSFFLFVSDRCRAQVVVDCDVNDRGLGHLDDFPVPVWTAALRLYVYVDRDRRPAESFRGGEERHDIAEKDRSDEFHLAHGLCHESFIRMLSSLNSTREIELAVDSVGGDIRHCAEHARRGEHRHDAIPGCIEQIGGPTPSEPPPCAVSGDFGVALCAHQHRGSFAGQRDAVHRFTRALEHLKLLREGGLQVVWRKAQRREPDRHALGAIPLEIAEQGGWEVGG